MSFRANSATKFARSYPMIECAQCGEQLFVPEWSGYVDERCVRHLWGCEACDVPQSTHHERGVPNPPLPGGQLSRRAASGQTPNDLTVGRGPWREYFFRPRFGSAGPYFEQRFEL